MNLIEYKQNQYRKIELPSGLIVEMKKLSPFRFLQVAEQENVDVTEGDINKIFIQLICELSMSPKISEDDTSERNLCIYDISPEDSSILLETILTDIGDFKVKSFR